MESSRRVPIVLFLYVSNVTREIIRHQFGDAGKDGDCDPGAFCPSSCAYLCQGPGPRTQDPGPRGLSTRAVLLHINIHDQQNAAADFPPSSFFSSHGCGESFPSLTSPLLSHCHFAIFLPLTLSVLSLSPLFSQTM